MRSGSRSRGDGHFIESVSTRAVRSLLCSDDMRRRAVECLAVATIALAMSFPRAAHAQVSSGEDTVPRNTISFLPHLGAAMSPAVGGAASLGMELQLRHSALAFTTFAGALTGRGTAREIGGGIGVALPLRRDHTFELIAVGGHHAYRNAGMAPADESKMLGPSCPEFPGFDADRGFAGIHAAIVSPSRKNVRFAWGLELYWHHDFGNAAPSVRDGTITCSDGLGAAVISGMTFGLAKATHEERRHAEARFGGETFGLRLSLGLGVGL